MIRLLVVAHLTIISELKLQTWNAGKLVGKRIPEFFTNLLVEPSILAHPIVSLRAIEFSFPVYRVAYEILNCHVVVSQALARTDAIRKFGIHLSGLRSGSSVVE